LEGNSTRKKIHYRHLAISKDIWLLEDRFK